MNTIRIADPRWLHKLGWTDQNGNQLQWQYWVGRLKPLEIKVAEILRDGDLKPSFAETKCRTNPPYWRKGEGNTLQEKLASVLPPKPGQKTDWRKHSRRQRAAKKSAREGQDLPPESRFVNRTEYNVSAVKEADLD